MCSIAGKISFQDNFNRKEEIPLIEKTISKLHHRGPDDQGYYLDKNVWLVSTRLSVIDLSPAGHQPMQNGNKNFLLVFNGEIYNFRELRKKYLQEFKFRSGSDTETLLYLYEKFGTDCLKYLRGMFAFAIWDRGKKELFIARDRIGKKPLKYFFNEKFFIFASELKAFIDHPGVPREIDWQAINEFLAYQYVPSPGTGFRNVWKLPPAHYMIVKSDGSIEIKRYWNLDFSRKLNLSEEEWMERVTDKLKESVRLRLRSDVPLGVHLSGGVDSSLITALVSKELNKPLNTFSIGFKESEYNELPYARAVSDFYKTSHHEFIVNPDIIHLLPSFVYQYEEPIADPSILPTWYLMKESKKFITVALNGDGGDENFAGYPRYKYINLIDILRNLPLRTLFGRGSDLLYRLFKKRKLSILSKMLNYSSENKDDYYFEMMSYISSPLREKLLSALYKQKFEKGNSSKYFKNIFRQTGKYEDELDRFLYLDINSYLPELLMVKIDIASMAHSLEVRSPFLDHEFMELAAKMPSNLKLKGFQSKYLLKKLAVKYVPEKCLYRTKQGFVPPLDSWFRGSLYKYLHSQLSDRKFLSFGIFNADKINQLIKDHHNFRSNNTYPIWTMLVLKKWLECWFN